MSAPVPTTVIPGAEVVPVPPADYSPVQPQRLSTLEELLAGYLVFKRSVATRAAYRPAPWSQRQCHRGAYSGPQAEQVAGAA